MDPAELSLVETPDGLQVVYNGKPLYSASPQSGAVRKTRSVKVQPDTLYLAISPVAWHGLPELHSQLPESSMVLAIERDPVLLELARRLRPESPDGLVLCASELEEIRTTIGNRQFRRVREVSTNRGSMLNRDHFRSVRDAIERDIRTNWQNRITIAAMGRLWVSNLFRNLELVGGGRPLPRFTGAVVVCGAGPSLDRSAETLAQVEDSITIVAVDTALPCLAGRGIVPDVVVATEGQFANLYDFLPARSDEYVLIADLISSPAVIAAHAKEQIAWVLSRFAPLDLLDRVAGLLGLPDLPALGSVGVVAVYIALLLSDGPVVCSGLDFAVDEPGEHNGWTGAATHALGAPVHIAAISRSHRLNTTVSAFHTRRTISQPGLAGDPVQTTLPLVGYAEQMRAVIKESRREVYAIAPFGLDTGAHTLDLRGFKDLVQKQPKDRREPVGTRSGEAADPAEFLKGELVRLQALGERVESGEAIDLDEIDYLLVDLPDVTDGIDEGGRARLRVLIDYYAETIKGSLSRLRRS